MPAAGGQAQLFAGIAEEFEGGRFEIAQCGESACRDNGVERGGAQELTGAGGGSDGNFTAHLVPTLDGLGADGADAHTHGEHILLSSLVPRMTLLRRLFETLA